MPVWRGATWVSYMSKGQPTVKARVPLKAGALMKLEGESDRVLIGSLLICSRKQVRYKYKQDRG